MSTHHPSERDRVLSLESGIELCTEQGRKSQLGGADSVDAHSTASGPNIYTAGLRFWLAVLALSLGIFLVTLDSTIIATATPYITNEFQSLDDIGWYASIYSVAICVSQLAYGKLSTRYAMRGVYSIAMLLFLVGSAVCGSAPSSAVLISGRAISGLGSSGLLICAFSLVPHLASPEKRPIFLGLISAGRGIATTAGPLIGGALTERASWRWNFYINLPLGATTYALFLYSVHPPKRQTEGFTSWKDLLNTLDLPGLTFLSGSVICLFLGLQWGGIQFAWNSGRVIALLVLAAVFGLAFFGIQYSQSPQGMLPTRVSTQRTVIHASIVAFCSAGAAFILTYYLPIWFQVVKQQTPLVSGISTLPWVITGTVSSLVVAAIISKLGYAGVFMVLGSAMSSIGSGLFTTFQPSTSEGKWIGFQIVYALGSSLASLTGLMVVQRTLPLDDVPLGSGMIIFFQTLGGALFVSVAQSIFTNDLAAGLVGLGTADFDASTIATGGLDALTRNSSEDVKQEILAVINSALTRSWFLPVILSCISVCGTLGVEHRKLNCRSTT